MNTYRVRVSTIETFEIDAETEEQAATDFFDGALVYSGEPEVLTVTCIDVAESSCRWRADRAGGAL